MNQEDFAPLFRNDSVMSRKYFNKLKSIIMFKDLPKEINDALDLLWEYSDDACASGRTKEECEAEGYDCEADTAHYITFVISRKP